MCERVYLRMWLVYIEIKCLNGAHRVEQKTDLEDVGTGSSVGVVGADMKCGVQSTEYRVRR